MWEVGRWTLDAVGNKWIDGLGGVAYLEAYGGYKEWMADQYWMMSAVQNGL